MLSRVPIKATNFNISFMTFCKPLQFLLGEKSAKKRSKNIHFAGVRRDDEAKKKLCNFSLGISIMRCCQMRMCWRGDEVRIVQHTHAFVVDVHTGQNK